MDIIISHKTAFLFWRQFTGPRDRLPRARRTRGMTEPLRLADDILAELGGLGIVPSKGNLLHVLFSAPKYRSRHSLVVAHQHAGPLPPGSLLRVAPHVLVTSPELTFLQLARQWSPGRLIMAGCELCGTYALDAEPAVPDEILAKRPPLTTAKALEAFAEGCVGFAGRERACRAARNVFDNARSPMEAKTALLLCLPHRLGGRGLPWPVLNPRIDLTAEARALHRHGFVRADLYWPAASLDLEYDGDHHEADDTHANDVSRTAALKAQGIEVLTVAYPQVADPRAFALIAGQVAERLGWKLRVRRADFAERETELRSSLGFPQPGWSSG